MKIIKTFKINKHWIIDIYDFWFWQLPSIPFYCGKLVIPKMMMWNLGFISIIYMY
jgi:hypothetical protein